MWYVVCLAALTAMLRARGLVFSTLARTGLEPAVADTRAVDRLTFPLRQSSRDFSLQEFCISISPNRSPRYVYHLKP